MKSPGSRTAEGQAQVLEAQGTEVAATMALEGEAVAAAVAVGVGHGFSGADWDLAVGSTIAHLQRRGMVSVR